MPGWWVAVSGRTLGTRVGKGGSLAVVALAYVTAAGGAWLAAYAVGPHRPAWALGLGYLVAALVIYAWSLAVDNGSMFDAWWSVLPPLAAVWLAHAATDGVPGLRTALVLIVVWVWGIRLTSNWARDWPGLDHEDWRYLELYTKGPKPLISLVAVHLFPAAIVFLGSLPLVPALVWGHRPVGPLDWAAAAVGLGAVALEFVADEQMRRFARTKRPGEVMDRGLWRYSRHPNYFGEILFWWCLWLFALAADPAWWWTVAGPAAMVVMFLTASIPMLDERSRRAAPPSTPTPAAPRPWSRGRRAGRPPPGTEGAWGHPAAWVTPPGLPASRQPGRPRSRRRPPGTPPAPSAAARGPLRGGGCSRGRRPPRRCRSPRAAPRGPWMATMASPESSQSVMVSEWAEVTMTKGPQAGPGEAAKKATKKCPVGVGYFAVPMPAGTRRTRIPRR